MHKVTETHMTPALTNSRLQSFFVVETSAKVLYDSLASMNLFLNKVKLTHIWKIPVFI